MIRSMIGLLLSAFLSTPLLAQNPNEGCGNRIAAINFPASLWMTQQGIEINRRVVAKYQPRIADLHSKEHELTVAESDLAAALKNKGDSLKATDKVSALRSEIAGEEDRIRTAERQELMDSTQDLARKYRDFAERYIKEHGYTWLLDLSAKDSPVLAIIDKRDDLTFTLPEVFDEATTGIEAQK